MDGDARRALAEGARQILGRPLTPAETGQFDKYMVLLKKWGSVHRLIGRTEPLWIVENLFLDSLLFVKVLPEGARSLMDLGSGAGVPGIPIKIVRPEIETTLLEARRRKVSFLFTAVRELGLAGTSVLDARAERLGPEFQGRFDAVVMRCAGPLGDLLDAAIGLLTTPGRLIVAGSPDGGLERLRAVSVPAPPSGRPRTLLILDR